MWGHRQSGVLEPSHRSRMNSGERFKKRFDKEPYSMLMESRLVG